MLIISKEKFFKNISTDHQVPVEVQKKLLNGNAQFIINLANSLQIKSYQITCLSIYICNYFFYKRSYLEHDRFIIACVSFLLASKIKDFEIRMKNIVFAYHKLVSNIYESNTAMNDNILNTIKEKMCIAEAQILRTIGFNFNFTLPFDYLDMIVRNYYSKEQIYYESKTTLFDMYRSQICFCYSPIVLAVSAFIMVVGRYDGDLLQFVQQKTFGNKKEFGIRCFRGDQIEQHELMDRINLNQIRCLILNFGSYKQWLQFQIAYRIIQNFQSIIKILFNEFQFQYKYISKY